MTWNLRYAAHLGFRSLEAPLFPASAGSVDPLAQIEFVATLGFAGIQDPWFSTRPREQQDAIAAALAKYQLAAGCVVCGSLATVRTPLWNGAGEDSRVRLEKEMRIAVEAASRLGATQVVALTAADPGQDRRRQIDVFVDNLRWAGTMAEANNLTLCLEPINARSLPGMLMAHFEEGCDVIRAVGHPSVRMIYDTAHIQSMDGDLLGHLEREWKLIEIVQIANHPGRTEPEVGEINMGLILQKIAALGYRGLVELEHLWSSPGEPAECRAIEWLRAVDKALPKRRGDHEEEHS
jgi:hydroxypyruvate isomerase